MSTELDHYIAALDGLIRKLSPAERKKLNIDIARKIRLRNKARIKANIEPGGAPYQQRKNTGRKLRGNEQIRPGQRFLYYGFGGRMKNIKTAASAAAPSHANTQPYSKDYVWGWDDEAGGIRKYKRSRISLPSSSVKDKLMFRKLHQIKYLKQKATDYQAAVGFMAGLAGQIASAHQYGEGSRPERQLLGFADDDLRLIEETVIHHLDTAK